MGWLSDALRFEKSHVKDLWSGIKSDPKRLILGVDPLSTGAWNAVLGRQDKPLVSQLGGPTEQNYANAEARGIDTGPARTMHGIAGTVAGAWGGNAAGGALNFAGGGLGGAGGKLGAQDWVRLARMGQMGANASMSAPALSQSPMPADSPQPAATGPQTGMSDPRRRMLIQALRGRGARAV